MFGFRRKKIQEYLGDDIKSGKIDSILAEILAEADREYCLDIGTGNDLADRFTTVDVVAECNPDILGDIRCCFAGSQYYRDMREQYPGLSNIVGSRYVIVRAKHIVEHIEWIYHQTLFEWLFAITARGGIVAIDTPNLDYVVKLYYRASELAKDQRPFKFPSDEYGGLKPGSVVDLAKWVQFKLFSGCSLGDYHHACLNRRLLYHYMSSAGFEPIAISDDSTLRAIAYKPVNTSDSMDAMIDKYIQGE